MTMIRQWRGDLKWGEKWERIIGLYLYLNGISDIEYNNDSRFDIKGFKGSTPISFEVKSDKYRNTGNMALEISDAGKLSGISISEADMFIYNYTNISDKFVFWFFIPLIELKQLLKDEFDSLRIINGGDNKESVMVLLPMAQYKKHFKVVNIPKIEWYL